MCGSCSAASAFLAGLAAETVRVGVLKFGTVNWELDTIKHHKLDEKHGVNVDVRFFAGEDATNVAMMAGEVDIIVTRLAVGVAAAHLRRRPDVRPLFQLGRRLDGSR